MHLDCGDSGLKLLQIWDKMEDEINDMEKAYVMREHRAFLTKGYTYAPESRNPGVKTIWCELFLEESNTRSS